MTDKDLLIETLQIRSENCDREIEVLTQLVREGTDTVLSQATEIEVLTTERDNAQLEAEKFHHALMDAKTRVEELERDVEYWRDIARSSLWVYPDA